MNKLWDVIVIGSGPAGLSAAYAAAVSGKKVAVLERNEEAAKKIYATGNGRCNFANEKDPELDAILDFCKAIGLVYTKEEDRYYPRSLQASSAAKAFISAAERAGAKIITSFKVSDVQKNAQGFDVKSEDGKCLSAEKLIVACGGKAGIQLGCTGDGYKWAQNFGINVVKPIPALTGFIPSEDISPVHGVRTYAKASIACNGEVLASDCGEVQFTRNGISGICVMNLSRYFRIGEGRHYTLVLDLLPEYTAAETEKLLINQNKLLSDPLAGLVPDKLAGYVLSKNKGNAKALAECCKALTFTIESARGWKDAQVTCGGVSLDELDCNYQSRKIPGLYFAGEVTDYDGPCGGFNIGYALVSGLKAGKASAE